MSSPTELLQHYITLLMEKNDLISGDDIYDEIAQIVDGIREPLRQQIDAFDARLAEIEKALGIGEATLPMKPPMPLTFTFLPDYAGSQYELNEQRITLPDDHPLYTTVTDSPGKMIWFADQHGSKYTVYYLFGYGDRIGTDTIEGDLDAFAAFILAMTEVPTSGYDPEQAAAADEEYRALATEPDDLPDDNWHLKGNGSAFQLHSGYIGRNPKRADTPGFWLVEIDGKPVRVHEGEVWAELSE